MPHPHARTWTLGTLDRGLTYRLWFDPVAFRWEVEVEGQETGALTTRPVTADEAGPRTQRSA
jgi:hypothetical protein